MDYTIYDTAAPLTSSQFEEIYNILAQSLPQSEMRTKEAQQALLNNQNYKLLTMYDKNEIIGFMAIWDLDAYNFIEHFAVKSDFRGNGIGGKMLKYLQNISSKPVILEVEPPGSTPEATRRIEFYRRNGFHFNSYEYFQPPLQEGFSLLPLRIMSYPSPLDKECFDDAKNILYHKIYGFFEKTLD